MKTNVWLNLRWRDFQLEWSTNDHKVGSFRVPNERVWVNYFYYYNNYLLRKSILLIYPNQIKMIAEINEFYF